MGLSLRPPYVFLQLSQRWGWGDPHDPRLQLRGDVQSDADKPRKMSESPSSFLPPKGRLPNFKTLRMQGSRKYSFGKMTPPGETLGLSTEDCPEPALPQNLLYVSFLLYLEACGKSSLITFRRIKSNQRNHEAVILIK